MNARAGGNPSRRAMVMLLATLVLGIAIGFLGSASLSGVRARKLDQARRPGGFVEHMMDIIQPTEEQRGLILPAIRATDERNRTVMDGANEELRAAVTALKESLAPHLSDAQIRRLDTFARRPPPGMPGAGRGGPDRGRPPPPPPGR